MLNLNEAAVQHQGGRVAKCLLSVAFGIARFTRVFGSRVVAVVQAPAGDDEFLQRQPEHRKE